MRCMPLLVTILALVAPGAQAADSPRPARGIHYLYLIRHGIYDRDSLADDRTGNGLNAMGREQATLVGARLAALPVKFHALVCSDFARARQTAEVMELSLGMVPTVDSLLHECTPTSDRADYMRNHADAEIALCDSNLASAWGRYMRPTPEADTHDVLVCHGNVIRWLVSRALGPDTRRWWQMEIGNASLTMIAVRPDGTTRLVMFSDAGHIPLDKQTWTGQGAGWGRVGGK